MAFREDIALTKIRLGKNAHVISNAPYDASFTIGTEGSNAITVAIQLLNASGNNLDHVCSVQGYLSASADGSTLEAASATLTITAGTDGIVMPNGAGNAIGSTSFTAVSESDGDIDLTITETVGANTFYLVLVMVDGSLAISDAITFA